MPTLECRVNAIETKTEKLIADVATIQETMIERRRQADKTQEVLEQIQATLADIQQTISSARGFVQGVTKTVLIVTTFFSAVGAAMWAIIDKLTPVIGRMFSDGG